MALLSESEQWRVATATAVVVDRLWPRPIPSEPKTVFDLFCTRRAAEEWMRALRERRLRVTYSAVFTHKKPYVTFRVDGRDRRCEVADLLLVVSFPERRRRHAILLQAKKTTHLVWPPSDDQWLLYTSWPPLRYRVGATTRNGVQMPSVPPLGRAQYLLLPPHPQPFALHARPEPGPPQWCGRRGCPICWPCWQRASASSLPYLIMDLFAGRTGAEFAFEEGDHMKGWSRLVWDLLVHTAKARAPRGDVGLPRSQPGPPRGTVLLWDRLSLASEAGGRGGGNWGNGSAFVNDEGPSEGIGVAHFQIGGRAAPSPVVPPEGESFTLVE